MTNLHPYSYPLTFYPPPLLIPIQPSEKEKLATAEMSRRYAVYKEIALKVAKKVTENHKSIVKNSTIETEKIQKIQDFVNLMIKVERKRQENRSLLPVDSSKMIKKIIYQELVKLDDSFKQPKEDPR